MKQQLSAFQNWINNSPKFILESKILDSIVTEINDKDYYGLDRDKVKIEIENKISDNNFMGAEATFYMQTQKKGSVTLKIFCWDNIEETKKVAERIFLKLPENPENRDWVYIKNDKNEILQILVTAKENDGKIQSQFCQVCQRV